MPPRGKRRAPREPEEEPEDGPDDVVLYEIGRTPGVDPLDPDAWEEGEEAAAALPARGRRRPRPPELLVLREEPTWTAVMKPAGLASVKERWVPGAPTAISLLHEAWLKADPAAPLPFVIHRIDKETSGLLLLGRTRDAARALSNAFRRRTVVKEYLALVVGSPPEPAGEIELRLGPDPRRTGAMRVEAKGGKKSLTAWETEEAFRGHTLLRVRPRTGRTHQIRVTLSHIGCPVVADPLYGDGEGLLLSSFKRRYVPPRDHPEIPLLGRLALHAHRLRFPDPAAPEGAEGTPPEVLVEAPLPKDFRIALEKLRRWGAARPRPFEPGPLGTGSGGRG